MSDQASYSVIRYEGAALPDQYRAFIYASWLRSLRRGNDFFKLIDTEAYYRAYPEAIKNILEKPATIIRLAVLTDDPDVVLGMSVCRDSILDFVYVQPDYRRQLIGKHLVPETVQTFTHITKTWMALWSTARFKHLKFNPFA